MGWFRRLMATRGTSGVAFFERAVSDAFAPLLEAGWTLSAGKNGNFGHRAELHSDAGRITISTDYREGLSVWIERKDTDGSYLVAWPGLRIELGRVLAQRGVTTFTRHDSPGWLAGDELRAELSRHADALLHACPELVDGDFSRLPIRRWPPQSSHTSAP